MSFFDDFLANSKVTPEDKAVLDRYPDLRASTEKMEQDLGSVSRFAGEWVSWQNQNWDAQANMTNAEKQLRADLADVQAKLTAATAPGSSVPAADIAAIRKEFQDKAKEIETKNLQVLEGMNMFYEAAAKHMLPHQKEFGENFDPKTFREFITKNQIQDPDVAYDKMVAGKRAELAVKHQQEVDAKHTADLEAARKEGYEKRAQEIAMGPNGMLPTDNTGGIVGVTSFMGQPAKVSDADKTAMSEAKLGDGSLAKLGYEKFVRGELVN